MWVVLTFFFPIFSFDHSVHWGYQPPTSKILPLPFLPSPPLPPLNLQTVQATSPFLDNALYIGFLRPPPPPPSPLKILIFK